MHNGDLFGCVYYGDLLGDHCAHNGDLFACVYYGDLLGGSCAHNGDLFGCTLNGDLMTFFGRVYPSTGRLYGGIVSG